MAAPRTFNDDQRAAMADLVNTQSRTLRETQRILASGHGELAPFQVSTETIRACADEAKATQTTDITDANLADALDTLGRKSLVLIGRRLAQVDQTPSRFDANEVLTIMKALTEAKGLVKAQSGSQEQKAPAWLEALGTNGNEPQKNATTTNETKKASAPVTSQAIKTEGSTGIPYAATGLLTPDEHWVSQA